MSGELYLRNNQRTRSINRRLLRWLIRDLLTDLLQQEDFDLTVHLVGKRQMTRLNETHLRHSGSTDVITFGYSDAKSTEHLSGEIFVCVDEAETQSRRFRTTWTSELVRYIIHGLLHIRGYDDQEPTARRRMKREENRLLKEIGTRFGLSKLELKSRLLM
jgi:probable rRNA maturation factor